MTWSIRKMYVASEMRRRQDMSRERLRISRNRRGRIPQGIGDMPNSRVVRVADAGETWPTLSDCRACRRTRSIRSFQGPRSAGAAHTICLEFPRGRKRRQSLGLLYPHFESRPRPSGLSAAPPNPQIRHDADRTYHGQAPQTSVDGHLRRLWARDRWCLWLLVS